MNKSKFRWFPSIRAKLISSFVFAIVIFSLTSLFTYYNEQRLLQKVNLLLSRNVSLKEYSDRVDHILLYLEKYLSTGNYDMLVNYHRESQDMAREFETTLESCYTDSSKFLLKNIRTLTSSFLTEAGRAVQAKRGRNSKEYNHYFNETARYGEYIKWGLGLLIQQQLAEDSRTYLRISKRLTLVQQTSLYLIIAALIFSLIITTWTTLRITKPLRKLVLYAKRITDGNLSSKPIHVTANSSDEVTVLASALNEMVSSLVRMIGEIKKQSVLEKKLQEQELQNLTMKNFLREAELHALQSQINPHFLYNTLNAAVQLAAIEGADRTSSLIDTLAHLLRYNLKNLGTPATLGEEIANLNRYFQILKTRFGHRFEIHQDIDPSANHVLLPNLTLQPLVENSLIHGLEDLEKVGVITLDIRDMGDYVQITIGDNGRGIPPDKLKELNEMGSVSGHTTGIGLRNVRERLRLFFNRDGLLSIESMEGKGTTIRLIIPKATGQPNEVATDADISSG